MTRMRTTRWPEIKQAEPTSPEELREMRRRAFVENGIAHICLADVKEPWTKQAIINEARRQLDLVQPVVSQGGRR